MILFKGKLSMTRGASKLLMNRKIVVMNGSKLK
jgi:hypothetical protein